MTHDASKAQRRTQPWSAQESAFLFNYVDWCLLHKKAYTEQISQAMLKHLSVQRTHSSINKKLRSLLVGNVAGCTVSKLYEYGTSYLDLKALSPGILDAMVSQRKDLGLSELNFSDTRQIDNTNSNATALEKCFVSIGDEAEARNSTPSTRPSRKTYRSDVSESSDGSYGETLSDSDFVAEPHIPPKERGEIQGGLTQTAPSASAPGVLEHTNMKISRAREPDDGDPFEQIGTNKGTLSSNKRQKLQHGESLADVVMPTQKARRLTQSNTSGSEHRATPEPIKEKSKSIHSHKLAPTPPSISLAASQDTIRGQLKDLAYFVFMLVQECKHAGQKLPEELKEQLEVIARTMEDEPGCLAERMLEDLTSANKLKAKCQKMLKALITPLGFDRALTFPNDSYPDEIDREWKTLRRFFQDTIVTVYPEDTKQPEGWAVGYFAARVEDLMRNDHIPANLDSYLEELKTHLGGNVHTVQNLLSALFCYWLFATPDLLCDEFYSFKEIKLFEAKLLSDGPVEVQKLDKIGAKHVFDNVEGNEAITTRFNNQVERLRRNLVEALASCWPSAPGLQPSKDPRRWLGQARSFKQTLLISPRDYRIHFCLPGTLFDPSWMVPEDIHGCPLKDHETMGKRVITCVFPALVHHLPAALDENAKLEDILIINKNFFPTLTEKQQFDPKNVCSKAFVLLE